jgi:Ca-activated chloride channel homolog
VPQPIEYFYSQDTPISVGLIFDVSGSMGQAIDMSQVAVQEFMRTSNSEDEFFLISFANRPKMLKDFTRNDMDVTEQMLYAKTGGRTAMLDAIYLGLSKMKNAQHPRRALIVISDGGDNSSRYTPNELLRAAREADVQIYTIGIGGADYDMGFLRKLTENTGGRMYEGYGWADTAEKISIELRNQYVIGYRSRNLAHDGQWRKVKVKLLAPKGLPPLSVFFKNGYYAPEE